MIKLFISIFISLNCLALLACGKPTWTQEELSILKSLSLSNLPPIPNSASNRYVDNSDAQALGKKMFFDKKLSGNGTVSCATCHIPEKFFTDGKVTAIGSGLNQRNTPTVIGSAWNRWFYWDGRRDSLWSQALIPFESPTEMGSSRVALVKYIYRNAEYVVAYEKIFGRLPKALLNKLSFDNAGPFGDASSRSNWRKLSKSARHEVNNIYANVGKAIEAYERSLRYRHTRLDKYIDSLSLKDKRATEYLNKTEIAGLKLFITPAKTQCLHCHNGPLLTNGGFHNIGTGKFSGKKLDLGRSIGIRAVLMDEFNCLGKYSDADEKQCYALRFLNTNNHVPIQGAFKTPSLRNVSMTSPYFHDGSKKNLADVLEYYNNPPAGNGQHELRSLQLNKKEKQQLIAFLLALENK